MIASPRKKVRSQSDEFRKLVHLGYAKEPDSQKIGFQHCVAGSNDDSGLENALADALEHITVDDELPIMTFCPTGGGKGISAIIPTLLSNPRPMIVMDPKGENFAVTARRRAELGHKVYALDPFNLMTKNSDGLNPLVSTQLIRN